MHPRSLSSLTVFLFLLTLVAPIHAAAPVEIIDTPDKGIQPRALVDAQGVLHVIWYSGNPKGGNLYHATRQPDKTWSKAVRVNSTPDSAIAMGTIRGAQATVGRDGLLHVIWNGFDASATPGSVVPMYYTRSTTNGRDFEPQRAISGDWPLDGGGALAADPQGNVHVFWHAGRAGASEGTRRIFVRSSEDDGKTFGEERAISREGYGVCACCAMQAIASPSGNVHVLYRTASDGGASRNMSSLVSKDGGKKFTYTMLDLWRVNACPMSSMSLALLPDGSVASAWEKQGQIVLALFGPGDIQPKKFTKAMGTNSDRKHPVLAAGRDGTLFLAWAEGTGWNKGGTLSWEMLDQDLTLNTLSAATTTAGRVPAWSFASAATVNGAFVLVR